MLKHGVFNGMLECNDGTVISSAPKKIMVSKISSFWAVSSARVLVHASVRVYPQTAPQSCIIEVNRYIYSPQ